jgi:type III pantothenate kinase
MMLAVDVGNTETVLGLFEHGELLDHWRLSTHPARTADELGLLLRALLRESGFDPDSVETAAVASVVPPVTHAFAAAVTRHLGARVHVMDATTPLPIRLDVDEPLSVGPDRIMNTLAALQLFHTDVIAVDFGTATTFDCITAAGVFVGGVITPGLYTTAESLVRRTAVLPRVELKPPATVIGRRTDTAIRSGILFGAIEAVDGIVRRIKNEWRARALVVATGGLAETIAPHCATVDRVEPYMTLYGLMFALRHLEKTTPPRRR